MNASTLSAPVLDLNPRMASKEKLLIPNSTQIPNVLIDKLFPFLAENELRALLYVARRTYGFQKDKDGIGLSQFTDGIVNAKTGERLDHGAGMSRSTAIRVLKILVAGEILEVKKKTAANGKRKENTYSINLDFPLDDIDEKLSALRKGMKWAAKPNLFTHLGRGGSVTRDTRVTRDTTPSVTGDTPTGVTGDTHKTKGNQVTKPSIYSPGAHRRMIAFFHDTSVKARGIKPIFGAADGKRLKDVLEMEKIPEENLEKMMLYFLASPRFIKFSPSLTTLFSSGILNGLQNAILNDSNFGKELYRLTEKIYPRSEFKLRPVTQEDGVIPDLKPLSAHLDLLVKKFKAPEYG
jgi:hypothetical protein